MDPVRQAAREAMSSRARADQLRLDAAQFGLEQQESALALQEEERRQRDRETLAVLMRASAKAKSDQVMAEAQERVALQRGRYQQEREDALRDRRAGERLMEALGVQFEDQQEDASSGSSLRGGSVMDKGAQISLYDFLPQTKASFFGGEAPQAPENPRAAIVGVQRPDGDPERALREWLLTERPRTGRERSLRGALGGVLGGSLGGSLGAGVGGLLEGMGGHGSGRLAQYGSIAGGLGGLLGGAYMGGRPSNTLDVAELGTGQEASRRERRMADQIERALDPGRQPANFNAAQGPIAPGLGDDDFSYAIDLDEALQEDPMFADALAKGAQVSLQKMASFDQASARLEEKGEIRKAAQAKDTALAILERFVSAQRKDLRRYL